MLQAMHTIAKEANQQNDYENLQPNWAQLLGRSQDKLAPQKVHRKNTKTGKTIMPVTVPVTYKLTTFEITSLGRTDRWETA
jgi:hypothetical protein